MGNRFCSVFCVFVAALLVICMTWPGEAAIIRVNWDSPADGPGDDWNHASRTLTAAIGASAAGDEIWVAGDAAHPYVENITLKDGVGLYGGFAGNETSRDERDPQVNVTILKGSDGKNVVTAPSGANASTVLDGFTIRNGVKGISCTSSSPLITNNTIELNWRWGVYCCSSSSPTITANTISMNGWDGIYCEDSSPAITNNTISGNQSGIYCDDSAPAITNNILAFNKTGIGYYNTSTGTPFLRNNCVYNPDGMDYDGLSAGIGDINVDPKFQSAAYGRLHIQPDSACVDAGLDSAVGAGWKDMDGQPRIQGAHVDIGADESDGTVWPEYVPVIVRVSPDGVNDAAHDGSSWALAKRTVQAGIDAAEAAGGEVWVAAGLYGESITVPAYVYLYGGFAGEETSRDEREWGANSTVLDGGGEANVVSGSLGHGRSAIDGFTIRNGRWGISCSSSSSPAIRNNTISGNDRGGIRCEESSPTITNNTISENCGFGIDCSYSSPAITNNILAFNGTGVRHCGTGAPVLRNNCVFNPEGTNYDGLAAGAGDICADPKFQSTTYGRLHIQPDSACVDAGLDSAVGAGWKDMDGQPRIQGAHVDIGADESDGTVWPEYVPVIVRVSPDGLDDAAHDGSSWALAKRTVPAGIAAASVSGGEVWVAAGVYSEDITRPEYVYLYGGFAGDESSRDERDWGANSTVLSGGVWAHGGHRQSAIDGFTIWGLVYCYPISSPMITNNTISAIYCSPPSSPVITNNTISGDGDGIYCDRASPTITNNTISGNGGVGIRCLPSSSPAITNNTISGNRLYGIYCQDSSPTITNNTISGNGLYGIYCHYSSPTITNNTISGSGRYGIYCYSSFSAITNNIVAFSGKGVRHRGSGAPVLRNNCVFNPGGTDYDGLTAGTGDINVDPLFVNGTGGDLHLSPASPCINAGLDSAVGDGWLDMDGQPRVLWAHVDIGADEFTGAGAPVALPAMPVTAAWPDAFYLEQPDRACGIRVEKPGHSLVQGQTASVTGQVVLASNGEVSVLAESVAAEGTGSVEPVIVRNISLGGAGSGLQPAILGSLGLNNIGLLVTTAGTVSAPRVQSGWFYVDDGSGAWDGTGVGGIYVNARGLLAPPAGSFAAVTGISSCEWFAGNLVNVLRPRSQADILVTGTGPAMSWSALELTANPRSVRK